MSMHAHCSSCTLHAKYLRYDMTHLDRDFYALSQIEALTNILGLI